MILDQLANGDIYRQLGPRYAAAFDYLRSSDFSTIADGRHQVIGDEVYAIVVSYATKPAEKGLWEAHRRYTDIQCMIRGTERMGVAPISTMRSDVAYDPEKDAEFFTGQGQFVTFGESEFVLLLPHDVHKPSLMCSEPQDVRKVVMKVMV
jgi:YhcH/YjgK/YiaL family protein